jgi:hypothetical protein
MNRILIFLFLCLIIQLGTSQITFSQEPDTSGKFVYPTINKYGKVLNDFSPKNWDITDTISGDLNKDGVDDFALIVVYKDSIKINNGYRFPRILLLVFKVGDHYELKLQHNTLIEYALFNENGNTGDWDGDPLENMEIANGVLKLHFKSDIRGALTFTQYIVRYQSNDFYLIGATCTSGYRASETTSDFNFSTGRYTYDMTDDETGFGGTFDEEHKKGKLPRSALKKLNEIESDEYWTPSDFIK